MATTPTSPHLTPDQPAVPGPDVVYLRADGASILLDVVGRSLPRVVHWGRDLGELSEEALAATVAAARRVPQRGFLDHAAELSVVPEASRGWQGRPGLLAHRSGRHGSGRLEVAELDADATSLRVLAGDPVAGVELVTELELLPGGLLRQRATVCNRAPEILDVESLVTVLPVPSAATEILDLAGRWSKERVPQRHRWDVGTHLREGRRGRTGADSPTVLVAGEPGFGFEAGQVWGVHLAWSGNSVSYAESQASGERVLGAGELLMPGEVRLAEGESYATPWVYAGWAEGLDALAARFHRFLRSARGGERASGPRPVTLNVWEAVYFDHDHATLRRLADLAHQVGIERYVLDDGWFRGRRDDHRGLGDWYVDEQVWPGESLRELSDHVHALGMEFGLWFEPEMINPDSDLFRAHPDWVLQPEGQSEGSGRLPIAGRHQQVLNIVVPEAWEYLRERIVTLVRQLNLDYVKWDHNRDLLEAADARTGRPLVREQTLAVYRLLDAIRRDCPGLEIESCSAGGARIDLGILQRTDRVWTSDCIDPLERQQIQRWTAQLLPPELMGAHIGSPRSHTTERMHSLAFRAVTAMIGHFGTEWDLTAASPSELEQLAEWVQIHKRARAVLHAGRLHRRDLPWLGGQLTGVVATDRSEAYYTVAVLARPAAAPAGRVPLPGLDAGASYRVRRLAPAGSVTARHEEPAPQWWASEVVLPGAVLTEVGLPLAHLHPENGVLLHAERLA